MFYIIQNTARELITLFPIFSFVQIVIIVQYMYCTDMMYNMQVYSKYKFIFHNPPQYEIHFIFQF